MFVQDPHEPGEIVAFLSRHAVFPPHILTYLPFYGKERRAIGRRKRLERMWLIDAHEDLAWNATELGRDETSPLARIRQAEGATPAHGEGMATVSLPSLRAAEVRVVLATVFTYPEGSSSSPRPGYHSPDEAFARAMTQIDYYHRLHTYQQVTLLRTRADLDAVIDGRSPRPGFALLMEGADPIRTPDELGFFVERGVRFVGLSWKRTHYAGGTNAPGPLTDAGRALLREMARLGVTLDVSHLAEEAFWQAMELFPGRVIASHANCRALVPTERQLSDAMIRAVAERDGVIGLVCYNKFISLETDRAVTLDDMVRHADHIAQLVGSRHVGLGSDLDGGIGREVIPQGMDSIEDLPRFADALAAAGYDESAIMAIMGGNWLRVLQRTFEE